MPTLYVPILKGKDGEFGALEMLDASIKDLLVPMIEVPEIPYDYAQGREAKSLGEHLAGIPARLTRALGNRLAYLDVSLLQENRLLEANEAPFASLLNHCYQTGVRVAPVINRSSSPDFLNTAKMHASRSQTAIAVRLRATDFDEDVDLEAEIDRLAEPTSEYSLDLVVDLADLGSDSSRATLISRYVLQQLPRPRSWRRVVLAGASFPEDLSEVSAATSVSLPRSEWKLWTALQRRPGNIPRPDITFGDYAISNPVTKGVDPRLMRMSASIRYTTESDWLIVKGRNVNQFGYTQYYELSRMIVEGQHFSGSDFSWGDGFIEDCANRIAGPGNATTWRKVGVNHHLTLVTRELSSSHHVA